MAHYDDNFIAGTGARGSAVLSENTISPIVKKWSPLMRGIQSPRRRKIMASILETQATWQNEVLTEEVRANVVGNITKVVYPMIRRAWAETIAPEIVSVQPLPAAIGAVAFFHPRYGSTKGGVTEGDEMIVNFDRDYSSERINGQPIGVGDAAQTVFTGTTKKPLRPSTLRIYLNGTLAGTANSAGVIVDSGSGLIAAGSQVNPVTGTFVVIFTGAPAAGVKVLTSYEYDSEGNADIASVRFDVQVVAIQARARKLKLVWSAESEEDLRSMWSMDITAEMVGNGGSQMALEVDREIIQDLLGAAKAGNNKKEFDAKPNPGVSLEQHLKGIVVPIAQVSALIHKRTLKGEATHLIVSPEVGALLMSTPYFTATTDWKGSVGIYKSGVLQGKWTVFVDPYMERDTILVLRQGESMLDSGYVFAPYVAFQVTGSFFNPSDQTVSKGLRTRYAKLLTRPEYYGLVTVLNV